MEPVTINLDGMNEFLTQFGPMGYVLAYGIFGVIFGVVSWRQIGAAAKCHGKACDETEGKRQKALGEGHDLRSAFSGVLAVVFVVMSMSMSWRTFVDSRVASKEHVSNSRTVSDRLVNADGSVSKEAGESLTLLESSRQRILADKKKNRANPARIQEYLDELMVAVGGDFYDLEVRILPEHCDEDINESVQAKRQTCPGPDKQVYVNVGSEKHEGIVSMWCNMPPIRTTDGYLVTMEKDLRVAADSIRTAEFVKTE